jgi:hypothetical protein
MSGNLRNLISAFEVSGSSKPDKSHPSSIQGLRIKQREAGNIYASIG